MLYFSFYLASGSGSEEEDEEEDEESSSQSEGEEEEDEESVSVSGRSEQSAGKKIPTATVTHVCVKSSHTAAQV